jgi:hypothetical protein
MKRLYPPSELEMLPPSMIVAVIVTGTPTEAVAGAEKEMI